MAALDVDELKKHTRWITFYNIVQDNDPLTVAFDTGRTTPSGKVVIKDFLELENNGKLKSLGLFSNNDQSMIRTLSSVRTKTFIQVKFETGTEAAWKRAKKQGGEGPDIMRIDRLFKSDAFKDGKRPYNRGNIAEGIFSAALVARFQKEKPDFTVTRTDVEAVIKELGTRVVLEHTISDKFTSPNKPSELLGDDPEPDTIIWKVGLGHEDMKALINKDIRSSAMTGIYDAAVKYANGLTVRGWDKEFYENNRVDIITVAAQGGVDQTGTKTAVAVWFTDKDGKDHKTSLEYSVKVANIKQFSQRGGTKFETLALLMKEFYGHTLTCKTAYHQIMNQHPQKIDEALSLAYDEAWTARGSGAVMSFTDQQKKIFSKTVKYHAQKMVGDMPQLNLLDTGQPDIKDFNLMEENLAAYPYWSVERKVSDSIGGKLPRHLIRVHGDRHGEGKVVLELRVKIETLKNDKLYYRSVVENGKSSGILVGYTEDYSNG